MCPVFYHEGHETAPLNPWECVYWRLRFLMRVQGNTLFRILAIAGAVLVLTCAGTWSENLGADRPIVPPLAPAGGGTGRITGRVIAEDTGKPLAGVNVEVMGPGLTRKMRSMSDSEGRFTVESVPAGAYTVKATFVGYLHTTVRNVGVIAGESVEVHIRMVTAPYELEAIVVSASRRAENIVDAPVSISKVNAKEIQRNATGNSYVSDLKYVKGIDYQQIGIFTEKFNARGYNLSFNTRMIVLTDGRLTRNIADAPHYGPIIPKGDHEATEVIVGPGTALYGPDAISGVVSLRSKDPRHTQGTTVAVSGGSREIFKGRFRHAGLNGKWGWKVSGEYQRGRDFERIDTFYNADSTVSVTDDPDFDARVLTGGVGLYFYPDGESGFRLSAGAIRHDHIFFSPRDRGQSKNQVHHYQQMTYHTPDLYLNIYHIGLTPGRVVRLGLKARLRLSGLPAQEAEERALAKTERSLWEAEARYGFHLPRLKGTRFTLGTNFRWERTTGNLFPGGRTAANLAGFYGHSETDLSRQFRLVLASRIDKHEIYDVQLSPKAALIFKPKPAAAFRLTFNRAFKSPTPLELEAVIRVPRAIMRGNGEGFRFGTVTGAPLPPRYADGIPKLKPEENTTFELGFKGILGDRAFLDITGYRSRSKNFISDALPIGDARRGVVTLDENGNPRAGEQTLSILNFGKQTISGFDVGMNVYATDRIVLKGNASFIKADDLEDAQGLDVPFNTPETILNLGLSTHDFLTERTSVDLSLRHVSEHAYRSGIQAGTVPTYTVVGVNLGYRTASGVGYKVSAQNVLNNKHREFVTGPKIGKIVVGEIQYDF